MRVPVMRAKNKLVRAYELISVDAEEYSIADVIMTTADGWTHIARQAAIKLMSSQNTKDIELTVKYQFHDGSTISFRPKQPLKIFLEAKTFLDCLE